MRPRRVWRQQHCPRQPHDEEKALVSNSARLIEEVQDGLKW